MNNVYIWLILGLAIAWFLQLFLSTRQLRHFYARFNELRKAGRCAIGMEGSVYRRRVYAVLVVDDNDKVTHAEQLSGWTVFAKLRPVQPLVGNRLDEVADGQIEGVPSKIGRAFQKAAADILAADEKEEASASTVPG
jgi:DNA-binding transcriptional regulator of glucitol operon